MIIKWAVGKKGVEHEQINTDSSKNSANTNWVLE